ncbi:HTH-type transcriptional regulator IscR [Candidatus Kinetoplastibacterium sorsogonicusi]|uniref:HTH-type transcriptional regulator IscR n=1 Tax=Candidatus Kinetoplastidibacterium kentomonadis TaxID=1576550 RepID=A0A3Q8EU21_9PROT|nr:Rrf2 family transcriptional regulator [Candidatus Kinetoplastibacterium sorsogonicusi]AWD32359.1 HTH-type transcriptional regulator IscR [Candidatus Kinetoplastibacterium sorsogonicusi]
MKLNTKGRFAVIAMIDIAIFQRDGRVNVSDISKRQNISMSYLEQLLGKLRNGGLLNSMRGPKGGYLLNKSDKDIKIADIIFAIEESLDTTSCHGKMNCNIGKMKNSKICITHNLWTSLNKIIWNYLKSITLHDLINNKLNNINNFKKEMEIFT